MGWIESWKLRLRVLKRETYVLLLACRDIRTPWYAKLMATVVVAYAFSPIDLIPDFIPVLGLLDDLVLIPLGVLLVRRLVPVQVMDECRVQAESAFEHGKPVNWTAAVVIVVVWIVSGFLCYYAIQRFL